MPTFYLGTPSHRILVTLGEGWHTDRDMLYDEYRRNATLGPLMAITLTMQDQLAELRMLIKFDDPVHAEAEAEFAAMIARIVRGASVADSIGTRMMLGTAEAYDGLEQHAECRQTEELAKPLDEHSRAEVQGRGSGLSSRGRCE
jgi:hypothetical protein